ncbi:hypothetical protein [Duganella vulcania]|uniref:Uncharacterized protein n=1 Tax=Duganella vulcania TaxID=2692166 RepID=A0A845GL62_9BURK|nr:hypothetical protein [Duganella vulcania]MYM94106.1 hypothetical protein [Duganella vulcania]
MFSKKLIGTWVVLAFSGGISFFGMSYLVKHWGLIALVIFVLFLLGGFRALPWNTGPLGHAISLGIAIGFFLAPIFSIMPHG